MKGLWILHPTYIANLVYTRLILWCLGPQTGSFLCWGGRGRSPYVTLYCQRYLGHDGRTLLERLKIGGPYPSNPISSPSKLLPTHLCHMLIFFFMDKQTCKNPWSWFSNDISFSSWNMPPHTAIKLYSYTEMKM